jgi:exoribonuclease R
MKGECCKQSFYSAAIHSKRRFSYQEALVVLRRKPAGPIEQMLHQTHQLAQRIRAPVSKPARSNWISGDEKFGWMNEGG